MRNPHEKADGSDIPHIPLKQVFYTPRPPVDDPEREEYDAALRNVVHLVMIFSGMITIAVLTAVGVNVFIMIGAQSLIPAAIQEIADFKLHI